MTGASSGHGPITVYLGLGSNLGDRRANLMSAVERLSENMTVVKLSSVYETDPVGNEHQPLFLNAVLSARADLEPPELLRLVKGIERDLGRVETFRNAPRAIDIDILFYGDSVIRTEELTVPHPGVAERAFVLVPLAEIASRMLHPLSRTTIADLLAGVSGLNGVRLAGSLDGSEALD